MNNIIEKGGKRAQIGEIREFGGRTYIKTSDGWKFHGKGTGVKTKQHTESIKQHNTKQQPQNKTKKFKSSTINDNPANIQAGSKVLYWKNSKHYKGTVVSAPTKDSDEFAIRLEDNSIVQADYGEVVPLVKVKDNKPTTNRKKYGYDVGDVIYYYKYPMEILNVDNKGGVEVKLKEDDEKWFGNPPHFLKEVKKITRQKMQKEILSENLQNNYSVAPSQQKYGEYKVDKILSNRGIDKLSPKQQIEEIDKLVEKYHRLFDKKQYDKIPEDIRELAVSSDTKEKKRNLELKLRGIKSLEEGDKIRFEGDDKLGADNNEFVVEYPFYRSSYTTRVSYKKEGVPHSEVVVYDDITTNDGQ